MSMNINRFQGEWHIWWVQGFEPVLEQTGRIAIGTGVDGAQEPFLSDNGEVCAGFTIYEPDGTLYASSDDWGPLVLIDGQLRWEGADKDGQPLRIYISLAEGMSKTGPFVSLYGSTLRGDPDQVAVWGANDGPPKPDPV
jgi:hypothetical protein